MKQCLADLIGRLTPEPPEWKRTVHEPRTRLKRIQRAYGWALQQYSENYTNWDLSPKKPELDFSEQALQNIKHVTNDDVQAWYVASQQHYSSNASSHEYVLATSFLHALIEKAEGNHLTLILKKEHPAFGMDWNYDKRIALIGDINHVGTNMKKGTIIVKGNAGVAGERMRNGTLVIEGDAWSVGRDLQGGLIVVTGKAEHIGNQAQGGRIYVGGVQVK